MYTAKIESHTFTQGELKITVNYASPADSFNEVHQIYSLEELNKKISARLNQLNALAAIEIPVGQYIPTPVVHVFDPKQKALNDLHDLKNLVDLGVIEKTDPSFLTAIQEVKGNIETK